MGSPFIRRGRRLPRREGDGRGSGGLAFRRARGFDPARAGLEDRREATEDHALAVERHFGRRLHARVFRSEEHTSELQSLMRISYAVFCLKKKKSTCTDMNHR